MEKHYSDETFLARWISGDLSKEELEAFKASKDYEVYKSINEGSQNLKVPEFNKEATLGKLKSQLQHHRHEDKAVKHIPNWIYVAAAILIVAIGMFNFIQSESRYSTSFGEQLTVVLPDNSTVELNAKSYLEFNPKTWEERREVELQGEAFFDVETGATFKVLTHVGSIEVLGTEFNVIASQNYFEVQCHEGRVQVKNKAFEEVILTPGRAFRVVNLERHEWTFTETRPGWLQGETTFKEAPLLQVIKALENQFDISFDTSKTDTTQKYTGGFPHKSLKTALKLVFVPLNISYTIKDENKVILVSKDNK